MSPREDPARLARAAENAKEFAREIFRGDASGHDFAHTLRVCRLARTLAEMEGAQPDLAALAALLHDVDDAKLSPATHPGKDRAVAFMRSQGLPEETVREVVEIVSALSFAGSGRTVPASLEGKCVQDADRLDALGALGVARAFAYGGSHGRTMHDPAAPPRTDMTEAEYRAHPSTTVNHFYEKLFRLEALMNTDAARAEARKRTEFMREFLSRFLEEWEGRL